MAGPPIALALFAVTVIVTSLLSADAAADAVRVEVATPPAEVIGLGLKPHLTRLGHDTIERVTSPGVPTDPLSGEIVTVEVACCPGVTEDGVNGLSVRVYPGR